MQTAASPSILVVEDDYLLARQIHDSFSHLGFEVLGPVSNLKSALRLLADTRRIDAAVLDINLQGDMAYPLALALEEKSVPFVFATGYGEDSIPARFADVARLQKPFAGADLATILRREIENARGIAPSADEARPLARFHPFLKRLQEVVHLDEADERLIIKATGRTRRFKARQEIVAETAPAAVARVVLDGFVYRYTTLAVGSRHVVSVGMPGDILDTDFRSLDHAGQTLAALTDCVVAEIPPAVFEELTRHGRIGVGLARLAAMETALLRQWLVNVGGRPSDMRMAHFLLEWTTRMRSAGLVTTGACAFPMSQEDLAQTLAMSGVHVNRTLQRLRKLGLVTVHDRSLTILDQEKLRRLCDFNGGYLKPATDR